MLFMPFYDREITLQSIYRNPLGANSNIESEILIKML